MKSFGAVLVFSCLASQLVGQADDDYSRKTLVGLTGVHVVVGPKHDQDPQLLNRLQTDVELKLRESGIRILSEDEVAAAPGAPFLYVYADTLDLHRRGQGTYAAWCVQVELLQEVSFPRMPGSAVALGRTWNAPVTFGASGGERLEEAIRGTVRDLTDKFVNAYLAANPKR